MNKKAIRYMLVLGLILLILACSFGKTPASPTAILSERPTPTQVERLVPPTPQESQFPDTPIPVPTEEMSENPPESAPDVSRLVVVYLKDSNLWLWSNGQNRQVTTSGAVYQPRISDDGEWVAFLRPVDDFHIELWGVILSSGEERKLVSVADLDTIGGGVRDPSAVAVNPYQYEWVPGTHTLAFNTQQVFQGPGLSLLDDLNLVNADSGEITYLLLSGWGGNFTYSPDGRQIAISTPAKIFLADADGGDYREIFFYDAVITYSEYRYYATPRWSPDGTFLRLALPPVDPLARPMQPTSLWTIPIDGTGPVRDGGVGAVAFFESPVEYSPDLIRIAYLVEVGQPAENLRELHIATYDGQGDWVYSKAAVIQLLGWSPDSQHFIYTTGLDRQTWLGSIDDVGVTLGADPYGISNLQWVDARRLLYVKEQAGAYDFYLVDLDGQATLLDSVLAPPPGYDFALR
jgi:Tol biopolymer transport system component